MPTVSTTSPIRQKYTKTFGCAGSAKQPTSLRSAPTTAYGFLKQPFLPRYEIDKKKLPKEAKAKKEFFTSLAVLSKELCFDFSNYNDYCYPFNILLAKSEIEKQLKKTAKNIELTIIKDDKGKICLATNDYYPTSNTLYYIPVIPLYRLLQNKKEKRTAELLLSVFSYLYHIARIPYYRENHSYLYYHYECNRDMLIDVWDDGAPEDNQATISEFNIAYYYGEVMLRKMYNPCNLIFFQNRIDCFSPKTALQKACLLLAQRTYELMIAFPDQHIFQNTAHATFEETDEIISAEHYISFVSETHGLLFDAISQSVNDEFNECSDIDEPTVFKIYDKNTKKLTNTLDFEKQLFPLIIDLCTLLNDIP